MKIKYYITIIAFISFFKASSQDLNFKSYVVEEQNFRPVQNAIVIIQDLNIKVKSNSKGEFTFTTKKNYGNYIGTIKHESYITKEFLIEFIDGKPKKIKNILLKPTYKEGLKRKRIAQIENIKKAKLKKIKLKEERRLAKQNKTKNNDKVITNYEINAHSINKNPDTLKVDAIFSDIQYKYAKILNIPIENLSNNNLYNFIDKWYNKPFDTKQNKALFIESLYLNTFGLSTESSFMQLYNSKFTNKFNGKQYLREGDLLFFNETGDIESEITHIGMYLHNNKFVHNSENNNQGIIISDLTDDYWLQRYVSAGRRINNQ